MIAVSRVDGSFRDPSGHLFRRDGILYRQINRQYQHEFSLLSSSGLYEELAREGMLIPHREVELSLAENKLRQPRRHPAEAARVHLLSLRVVLRQLKDAALLTLDIQRRALERGLTLRDASAQRAVPGGGAGVYRHALFRAQRRGPAVAAYRQFCEHFLAPLALMGATDVRCAQLLRHNLNGVPLDLASAAARLEPTGGWDCCSTCICMPGSNGALRERARATPSSAATRRCGRTHSCVPISHLRSTVAGATRRPAAPSGPSMCPR